MSVSHTTLWVLILFFFLGGGCLGGFWGLGVFGASSSYYCFSFYSFFFSSLSLFFSFCLLFPFVFLVLFFCWGGGFIVPFMFLMVGALANK